uniref:(northern house mosquito) hypothetical protein n=1 Tax=Culex pipiens TaxID=7175 RepID=A0A8D8DLN8_CULPI
MPDGRATATAKVRPLLPNESQNRSAADGKSSGGANNAGQSIRPRRSRLRRTNPRQERQPKETTRDKGLHRSVCMSLYKSCALGSHRRPVHEGLLRCTQTVHRQERTVHRDMVRQRDELRRSRSADAGVFRNRRVQATSRPLRCQPWDQVDLHSAFRTPHGRIVGSCGQECENPPAQGPGKRVGHLRRALHHPDANRGLPQLASALRHLQLSR